MTRFYLFLAALPILSGCYTAREANMTLDGSELPKHVALLTLNGRSQWTMPDLPIVDDGSGTFEYSFTVALYNLGPKEATAISPDLDIPMTGPITFADGTFPGTILDGSTPCTATLAATASPTTLDNWGTLTLEQVAALPHCFLGLKFTSDTTFRGPFTTTVALTYLNSIFTSPVSLKIVGNAVDPPGP